MTTTDTAATVVIPTDVDSPDAWNAAYTAADRSEKINIRNAVKSIMMDAIDRLDMDTAHAAKSIMDGLTTVTTRPTVDVTAAHADKINSLRAAVAAAIADAHNTTDVDSDRLADMITGDFSDAHVTRGDKINSSVRVATGDRAPGRDLAAVFADIVATVEPGTFMTCAEIQKWGQLPSAGAVAARLFPANGRCTVPNVTPVAATADRPRGAVFGA